MPDVDFVLRRIFKKTAFRPLQRDIICAAIDGHDVFVQAATSFGKSLCYQLPAVIDHGITICISPLLSLMRDQVLQLEASGIQVATFNSSTPPLERDRIMADLKCGHPITRLLYVTPELCLQESFRGHLRTIYGQGELARVAIDEAHCISEWGREFRSSYRELSFFRVEFPEVPIMCLTATATASVREDVISVLSLNKEKLKVFTTSASRLNLHYDVQFYSDHDDIRLDRFVAWLRTVRLRALHRKRYSDWNDGEVHMHAISGIIYTSTRNSCDGLARSLRKEGIGAAAYHAGLTQQDRHDCQNKWLTNTPGYEIMVATTAFGMGINKDDVRFVLHWNLPKSFEGFYQEAGRAGRDGKASLCTIYYSREDCRRVRYRIRDSATESKNHNNGAEHHTTLGAKPSTQFLSFQRLVDYCESVDKCRHRMVTEYFGEAFGGQLCDYACDFCKDSQDIKRRKELGLARTY